MRWALFDATTGRIAQFAVAPADDIAALAGSMGLDCLPAPDGVSDATHYVASGAFVAMPVRPSQAHLWDWSTHSWIDPRTPQQVLDEQWAQVRARRNRIFAATVDRINPFWEASLTPEQRAEAEAFRLDLIAVTDQSDPFAIVWPTPPAWLAGGLPE